MSVTDDALHRVDNHWAVLAVGKAQRDRGLIVANARLVKQTVGVQLQIAFDESQGDDNLLGRLALAYELAAIEGLAAFVNPTSGDKEAREQCAAGAWRAFELRRLFDIPSKDEERVLHILHLSSVAYCGDRWSDLRRWYGEHKEETEAPSVADQSWDRRLLYRIFDCWTRLFRKKGWDDVDRVREIVAGLRADQKTFESQVLDTGSDTKDRAMALRLIALYHWGRGTELLAQYVLQGEPVAIGALLDKHFDSAVESAAAAADAPLETLMRWLHAASRQIVAGSVWWVARAVNSRVSRFIGEITKQQAMFELLPPQRAALQEQGLLDQAATAVVIDMPTSGGKTLLAQFRMLQALNQFDAENGWVAYVAPTRALASQITRRLRRDFEPIGVRVEQLTGAVEIDAFEEDLLTKVGSESTFHVLVATPEKLQLVIRNKKVPRPLALIVMDEAHNIEDENRGMRIELLLATIKQECAQANFLLLMPYVENAKTLAQWLAQDVNAGRAISFGTTVWKPNERIVGMFKAESDDSARAGWRLTFETLTTTPKTIHLDGVHRVGNPKPLPVPKSNVIKNGVQAGFGLQAAAMAAVLSQRGKTSIAVATKISTVWMMAREAAKVLPLLDPLSPNIALVQKFLESEISPGFELISLLARGVGVHHAGLSDEVRMLIEWLAEEGDLRVLCATTTIAQGINFPVSSVFLASNKYPYGKQMSSREFWNLAGRAGRMNHDSVGVVGLAAGNAPDDIRAYVSKATGELVSRLVALAGELVDAATPLALEEVIQGEQWEDFRCYVAHLWNEKQNLDAVLANTEQLLRNTFGYGILRGTPDGKQKADKLLEATRGYVAKLAEHPEWVQFADMTGFSYEGVGRALAGLNNLERKLTPADWTPGRLFEDGGGIADLLGVMLRIPQLSRNLKELTEPGVDQRHIADITKAWVSGKSIEEIATEYFRDEGDHTKAITNTCKAIYRNLVNNGTWGISALSRLSGIDFHTLSPSERRKINALPAMIYHGVKTEEGVLMRMNAVPRSVAEALGVEYGKVVEAEGDVGVQHARAFLKRLAPGQWEAARPQNATLSGAEYQEVWRLLSGEARTLTHSPNPIPSKK
ncbi:MAG: DEAD/DEAH box helicase [Chloroflexi bacterium]|nr:DEAD/DEAH box helicase [Chloroflexota bacterium]